MLRIACRAKDIRFWIAEDVLEGWAAPRHRTVTIDMAVSANSRPTDIALDSTGLKFFGAPFRRLLRNRLSGKGTNGRGRSTAKVDGPGVCCITQLTRRGLRSWRMN